MAPRKILSVLTAAAVACGAAAAFARQNPQPQPAGGEGPPPPAPRAQFPFADEKSFTAFPHLAPPPPADPPVRPAPGKGPTPHPALERLGKLAAAPVPADAPLLRKVHLARLRAGYEYLVLVRKRIDVGAFQRSDYNQYLEMQATVYRLAADLAATPAEKVAWLEDAVRAAWEVERFSETAVRAGHESPQALNLARFRRLAAEADLLRLKS